MTAPYVNLSQHQLADLSIPRDQKSYAAGYEYMRDIVRNERLQTTDTDRSYELLKLENWLDRAASINSKDGPFSSEFVRGETIGIRERLGNPLSEAEFQAASDALARTFLNEAITGFGIPSAKILLNGMSHKRLAIHKTAALVCQVGVAQEHGGIFFPLR